MEPLFETPRLYVRPYTTDDLDNFYRLNGDEEIMRYIRPVKNREETREYLEEVIRAYAEQPGLGRWAMLRKDDHVFVGAFAVIPVRFSADIQLGYALLKEHWGKGYASESVQGGIGYAFSKLGLESITGITEIPNIASQKVLLKCGFVFEKTFVEEEKELNFYRLTKYR